MHGETHLRFTGGHLFSEYAHGRKGLGVFVMVLQSKPPHPNTVVPRTDFQFQPENSVKSLILVTFLLIVLKHLIKATSFKEERTCFGSEVRGTVKWQGGHVRGGEAGWRSASTVREGREMGVQPTFSVLFNP